MKVSELAKTTNWQLFANSDSQDKEIKGVYVGDLLSWVMGHGQHDQAWITIQAHSNVIAVAVLKEFACLIICENSEVSTDFIKQAMLEDIPLFVSGQSAYEVCKTLIKLGI